MKVTSTDLVSLFEDALKNIPHPEFDEVGVVTQVGDDMCHVHGLKNVVYGEQVNFEGGNKGIVFNLDENAVVVFLLFNTIPVKELEIVKRTGSEFKAPVGKALLGRAINAMGKPIDAHGPINADDHVSIQPEIASIIERSPINESLETGIMVIDALVPIGKGQRELIIGNRNTGKTSVALDAILHQQDKNVICIYVSIGQRQTNVARIVRLLEEHDALKYTVMVSADASEAILNQWLAPYVGSTIGEYFRSQGKDVLIVYDDLSNHAIAFRQMSLLMRQAPGREAYPGDVFYLHARLLERAGKLINGGSLTALPIVQIQSDDITAYIPTNLISITDGQLFLDAKLFNQGIRPAVNVELSVSRVGGAAQTKAIKKMTKALRLELAQYHELLSFAQFGTELDEISQMKLQRGALAIELMKQSQFMTYNFVDQSFMLFLLKENFLNNIALKNVSLYVTQFVSFVASVHKELYDDIFNSQDITDEQMVELRAIAHDFDRLFVPSIAQL